MPRHSDMGVPQEHPSVVGPSGSFTERRNKPRVTEPLHARAWGVDASGEPFSIDCVLDNVSATGLYVKVPVEMNVCSTISLMVRLLDGPRGRATATIRGSVTRCDPQSDDLHGIAVAISELRYL
ncbi:MAG: PilZ domain-containing protein [Pyrinomonadaceae bacterium]